MLKKQSHEYVHTVNIELAEGSVATCSDAQTFLFDALSVLEVQANQTWRC